MFNKTSQHLNNLIYRLGEAPRAYVVAKPKTAITEDEVLDFVSERVASFKQLSGGVEVIAAIPKSAAGKILRKNLLQMYHSKVSK